MSSQEDYQINGRTQIRPPSSQHLKMGGSSPDGTTIHANNQYLLKNDQPWLPVMGELHFSRYPRQYWEESLLKMKAAGISIIASYLFWIHHEEIEGEWRWSDDCAYGEFVALCAKHALYVFPRIGPWVHGECRNGGFPDWLLKKCPEVRTNHPLYLGYVAKFYRQIFNQIDGYLFKHGGPIIGIQLENEYGHVMGQGHAEHIITLKDMAVRIGFDVPLYTVTGWGNAWVPEGEVLPLLGGYPSAPWTQHTRQLDPVTVHLFQGYANDANIGADVAVKTTRQIRYNPDDYPYFTCETGGGNQVTDHRRPHLTAQDITTILLTELGSGVNLPGYYVFHGGTHPVGKLSTFQESRETGYPNDVPVLSYDFQAPIREYGQLHDSYRKLKTFHLFLQDFGAILAPMTPVFPTTLPKGAGDAETLRYVIRTKDEQGFIFVSNYQRHVKMQAHHNVSLTVNLESGDVVYPPFSILPGTGFIWPFNIELQGIKLRFAQAQLVCYLEQDETTTYVFAVTPGVPPVYGVAASSVLEVNAPTAEIETTAGYHILRVQPGTDSIMHLKSSQGKSVKLLTLTQSQAENIWKGVIGGQQQLILTTSDIVFDRGTLTLTSTQAKQAFGTYPAPEKPLAYQGHKLQGSMDGVFSIFSVTQPERPIHINIEESRSEPYTWFVTLPDGAFEGVNDIFLHIDVVCDKAFLHIGGKLVADYFYNGEIWQVGLKRFHRHLNHNRIQLTLIPLKEQAEIYLDKIPPFVDGIAVELKSITAQTEYIFKI